MYTPKSASDLPYPVFMYGNVGYHNNVVAALQIYTRNRYSSIRLSRVRRVRFKYPTQGHKMSEPWWGFEPATLGL